MPRYSSQRHRKMMDESEYAIQGASVAAPSRESRIVNNMLQNSRVYKAWESRHADLILPAAEHRFKKRQIVALRNVEVDLVHRRALFKFIIKNGLRGQQRRHLFRIFHNTLDFNAAVLMEHQHYMLAVSSRVSADHLIDIMYDPGSKELLRQYEKIYSGYFEMKCYVAGMGDSECIELVRAGLPDARKKLSEARKRIDSVSPDSGCGSFDRQEVLARSGRYRVQNYMVG